MELSPSAHHDTFARDHLPPQELWPTFEFTLPELHYPERLNAAEVLLDQTITLHGADRTALKAPDGEQLSYGQLQTRANQIAQVLVEDLGLVPGNRVMLRGPNNAWLVACWLGVLKAGGIVVTTMAALRAQEISKLATLTRPSVLLSDHRFLEDALTAGAGDYPVVGFGGEGAQDLAALVKTKSGEFTAVDTAADDVALLGPTSGTTGVPKITMHFHRDILANADTFARHILQPTKDDVFAGSPPLAFTFGLGGLVVFPFRFGASSLLTERATPVELAEQSHAAGATILFTAPTAYRAILKNGKGDLLKSLRVAVSAGEHLPAETWHQVKDATGLELVNGIGSTELLHVFISAAGKDIKPGTTGKAIPGFRATVLDDQGQETAVNEPGRLAVIGPTGCRYLDDERQHNYICNGWNITGDVFYKDEDGYFVYQARSDNMIVSSGYNIGGPEVEAALDQHPEVLENAVVARPDANRGSIVCAFVVLVDGVEGNDTKAKELQDFVKSTIAPYKYPREIRFVTELPRNPSGKLQHFKLREQFARSTV
ncbi:AMP-binding protein [Glutamicibacter sp. MNS18]|uniref:AMP-binding protein n=1 Tax=Glutamicibacter sp. MNS18 TaxID=2989817 RepID=UPI0022368A82|nr:AMP-binding protein [Glutamicibacter sp. MNS18]MCW4465312.1 AMP-binding protein [Glutamicibacter sp. MNS18]